jgi:hypothetical protein
MWLQLILQFHLLHPPLMLVKEVTFQYARTLAW